MAKISRSTDPRWFQITALSFFLVAGISVLGFEISTRHIAVTLLSVILAQWVATVCISTLCVSTARISNGRPSNEGGAKNLTAAGLRRSIRVEYKSALITGCSLCLLLRSNSLILVALASSAAIFSKFLIRFRGKHIFNPANFGIALVVMPLGPLLLGEEVSSTWVSPLAWVSPGQWGSGVVLAFLAVCVGGFVSLRALRSDVSVCFLLTYAALVIGRGHFLGDPLQIAFHRLESGALLLFTFFMISDPKTTPNSRGMRLLYGALVAFLAFVLRFWYFHPNALIEALFICSPLVPVLDLRSRGLPFEWSHIEERQFA